MKLTKITLDPGGDGYFILFVDGVKFDEGDNYHEQMSYKIRGIVEFLEFMKIDHSFSEIKFKTKKDGYGFVDYDDYPPDEDESLDEYVKRMKKNFKIVK